MSEITEDAFVTALIRAAAQMQDMAKDGEVWMKTVARIDDRHVLSVTAVVVDDPEDER